MSAQPVGRSRWWDLIVGTKDGLPPPPDLSSTDIAVGGVFHHHMDAAGKCFPSIPTITRGARVDESTARRSIKRYEALGLLDVDRSAGGRRGREYVSNRYQATHPNPGTRAGDKAPRNPGTRARDGALAEPSRNPAEPWHPCHPKQ